LLKHYPKNRNVAGVIPDKVIRFLIAPNPSSRTITLGPSQSLAEMNTGNLPVGKGRPARKTDNLTAICKRLSRQYGSLDVRQAYGPVLIIVLKYHLRILTCSAYGISAEE
jgi:hypothetical protein